LGILAIVPHGFHLILGPIAWILGNNDLREMREGRMDREGESQTNIGRILGMVATILGLVGLVIAILVFFCIGLGFLSAIFGAASKTPSKPPPQPQRGMQVSYDGRTVTHPALLPAREILGLPEEARLLLVKASDTKHELPAEYQVADGPTWAHPLIAGDRIWIKDKQRSAVCP